MEDIRRDIHAHIADVMVEWQEITRDEPWLSLPAEHQMDAVPAVVLALADAALCDPPGTTEDEALVAAAAKHGRTRFEQGFDQALLFTEYHLIRTALWHYIRSKYSQAADTMLRIDAAITVATSASLFGFHRDELETSGQWPAVVQALIEDAPRRVGRRQGSGSGAGRQQVAAERY